MPRTSSGVARHPCHGLKVAEADVVDIVVACTDYCCVFLPNVEVLSSSTSGKDGPASYSLEMRAGGRATQQLFSDECWTVKFVSLHVKILLAW